MLNRRGQAATLLGQDVHQHRHVAVLGELQVLGQGLQIVAVYRTEVAQAELLE
jgi:hypothetical protein